MLLLDAVNSGTTTIEVNNWMLLLVVISYISILITFVTFTKTKIATIEGRVGNLESGFVNEKNETEKKIATVRNEQDKNMGKVEADIRQLRGKMDNMENTFTQQLYDLNSKVTKTSTMVEMLVKFKERENGTV